MLTTIWIVTLFLALMSVVLMFALIAIRMNADKFVGVIENKRQRSIAALLAFGQNGDEERLMSSLSPSDDGAATAVAFDYLDLLRGDEYTALRRAMARSDILPTLKRACRRRGRSAPFILLDRLATLDPSAAIGPLNAILNRDRRPEMRLSAAIALARSGNAPAIEVLLDKLGEDGQQSYRLAELFLALTKGDCRGVRRVAATTSFPAFTRATAVWALASCDMGGLGPILEPLVRDASPLVAVAALRATGHIRQSAGGPIILAALDAKAWQLRSEAADMCASFLLHDARPKLIALLQDEQAEMRQAAAGALACLDAASAKRQAAPLQMGAVA